MGTLKESVEDGRPAVKPDRAGKHKGDGRESRSSHGFPAVLSATLTARLRRERVTNWLSKEKLTAQF
jgi:hypothetical protein